MKKIKKGKKKSNDEEKPQRITDFLTYLSRARTFFSQGENKIADRVEIYQPAATFSFLGKKVVLFKIVPLLFSSLFPNIIT